MYIDIYNSDVQERERGRESDTRSVDVADVDPDTFDLSVKNPNKEEEAPLREPEEIIAEMVALDAESAEILKSVGEML